MDSETKYTERQRTYTVPKLQRILEDPRSAKLAYQDTEYLLDLIEDDDLLDTELVRDATKSTLIEIQNLQNARFSETQDVEFQREARRARRLSTTRAN